MSQSRSAPVPTNQNSVNSEIQPETPPEDASGDPLDPALAAAGLRRPIQCACGKRLLIRVARDGVVLRCPEHGVQFRYDVNPRLNHAGRK